MRARRLEGPTVTNAMVALVVAAFILAPMVIVIPMSFSAARSFEFPPPSYWLGYYRTYFSKR